MTDTDLVKLAMPLVREWVLQNGQEGYSLILHNGDTVSMCLAGAG